ncbi:hypothetical protein [Humibacter ginsenosidimutans]|uniref:Holin n=1 Tax=Humibacter ginsenosidimutans TaxID=2599293 RepID=A0A5B8M1N3_9MICO|nr:hypothetical protein [Humibacter ginsenosidimutans]QDZ14253.1 hypothetical protein FPZ11_05260 [Humibacter ginsenosidimutans]
MTTVSGGVVEQDSEQPVDSAPVTLPVAWRTIIYIIAAPLAVGLFDLSGHPIDLPNILHAAATALASLGAITAAAHIAKK